MNGFAALVASTALCGLLHCAKLLCAAASPRGDFMRALAGCAPNVYHRSMFIVPYGAPEGYEWFVALVVLVGLYFAVRNFMRARR